MNGVDVRRFWSKVDRSGLGCWEWTASVGGPGYGQIKIGGQIRTAHRIAFELSHGPVSTGMVVDHICRNKICCNPTHLREVTPKQNAENRDSLSARSRSGVRGVRWDECRHLWSAAVGHEGRTVNIGRFPTVQEAADAVRDARLNLHTHNQVDRETVR